MGHHSQFACSRIEHRGQPEGDRAGGGQLADLRIEFRGPLWAIRIRIFYQDLDGFSVFSYRGHRIALFFIHMAE
jgi:hypothetical protein